jgi:SAM-dependent methyltransferase
MPSQEIIASYYIGDYTVDRGETGTDSARVSAIVRLIQQELNGEAPSSILEIGCGAGNLLRALSLAFPHARTLGVEPAPRLRAAARSKGLDVHDGDFDSFAAGAERFSLIVSVNVLEHVPDPRDALRRIAGLLAPDGRYVQITPDGEHPNIELLFLDHLSSFTRQSLQRLADDAGLGVVHSEFLTGLLMDFSWAVLRQAPALDPGELPEAPADVAERREALLRRVRQTQRPHGPFYIFGAGEAADLLAAYAPEVFAAAEALVVDQPSQPSLHGLEIKALTDLPAGAQLLLAVHRRSLQPVTDRLTMLGFRPLALDWENN